MHLHFAVHQPDDKHHQQTGMHFQLYYHQTLANDVPDCYQSWDHSESENRDMGDKGWRRWQLLLQSHLPEHLQIL